MENNNKIKTAYYDSDKKEWIGWLPHTGFNEEYFRRYKRVYFIPHEEYCKRQVWDEEGYLYYYRLKYKNETLFGIPPLLTEEDCLKIIDSIKKVMGNEVGENFSYSAWLPNFIDESINVEETIKENGKVVVNMWY